MTNQVPIDKSALIARIGKLEAEQHHLLTKPKREREDLPRIPWLEDEIFDLKAQVRNQEILERMADPAYRARLAAMPPIKKLEPSVLDGLD